MTSKKVVIQLLLLCGAMGLSSCAGKPPAATVSQVSQAELAVQEAMHKKDYTQARRLAERALVNAQLAETKAEAEQARRAAAELRQSIEALRREAEQPVAQSR